MGSQRKPNEGKISNGKLAFGFLPLAKYTLLLASAIQIRLSVLFVHVSFEVEGLFAKG
jgi:hypothetical protein